MRRIIVFNSITLDGFMAGPNGELDWATRSDAMAEPVRAGSFNIDTILYGRVTYDMMAGYWPTPAAASEHPAFINFLNSTRKIVFSRSRADARWGPATRVADMSREYILDLKQQQGGDMIIFGSGSIVRQLASFGLIDEYQLMVNPVVLGQGKRLFPTGPRMPLKLTDSETFNNGLVFLRYHTLPGV